VALLAGNLLARLAERVDPMNSLRSNRGSDDDSSYAGGIGDRAMEHVRQDLRYAVRSLRKSPGFSVMAVLTLAVGIGSATALFSVVHAVLLRPLPYPEPERIVQVWQVNDEGNRTNVSDPNFADWVEQNRGFAVLAQFQSGSASVLGGDEPVWRSFATVSRDFFSVMGAQPVLGRLFLPEEQQEGGRMAVIVGHTFWQEQLGGTVDLGSRTLRLGEESYTVVGVMPPGFDFPDGAALWTPRELSPVHGSRTAQNWQVVGRLQEGTTVARAQQDLSRIARELKQRLGDDTWMADAAVVPLHEQLVGRVRPVLLVLLGAAGLLLLIAIANVSNLMLARMEGRQRELTVRLALGAGHWRLIRQTLAESLTLSLSGGVLGLVVAVLALRTLLLAEPGNLPRADEIAISPLALTFAVAVSVLAAVALAVVGAIRANRSEAGSGLASRERSHSASTSTRRLQDGLVVGQVALTMVLLVGAGLLGRTIHRLLAVDLGFQTEGIVAVSVTHSISGERLGQLHHQMITELSTLPGVREVGGSNRVPLTSGGANGTFIIQTDPSEITSFDDWGELSRIPERTGYASFRVASEGYFRAFGIPLHRGRLFDERDGFDAPHVAVISESLARSRWPGEEVIGKLINFGNMDGDLRPMRVVGIVGDVRDRALDATPQPTVYASYLQRPGSTSSFSYVLRGTVGAGALGSEARRVVAGIAPDAPPRIRTIEEIVAAPLASRRFTLTLLAAFGGMAMLLAALGIYGIASYNVTQRTREMGIRLALGSTAGRVLGLVVRQGAVLALVGVGIGTGAAYLLTRFIAHQLYGVQPTDPLTFAGAVVFLVGVALAAAYLPARRAARVDPMIALRAE
jgi:putative ABC transport system permease protein